jgi:hypothetical protein
MSCFDTLTQDESLIPGLALGLNRQITTEEARIQNVNTYAKRREGRHLI